MYQCILFACCLLCLILVFNVLSICFLRFDVCCVRFCGGRDNHDVRSLEGDVAPSNRYTVHLIGAVGGAVGVRLFLDADLFEGFKWRIFVKLVTINQRIQL